MLEESDQGGTVKTAIVQTYGDTVHKLIDRQNYSGLFLPGYKEPELKVRVSRTVLINPQLLPFN